MLWNLYGPGATQVLRCWNTCVKLACGVTRWSYNYFGFVFRRIPSIHQKGLGQYFGFFNKLLVSESSEIRLLANVLVLMLGQLLGLICSTWKKILSLVPGSVPPHTG